MPRVQTPTAGNLITPLGYDGNHFYTLRVAQGGYLEIHALEVALPEGAATAANQASIIDLLEAPVLPDGAATKGYQQPVLDAGLDGAELTSHAGGIQYTSHTVVPAGALWHVHSLSARDRDTAATFLEFIAVINAVAIVLYWVVPVTADRWYPVSVDLWLGPGDRIRAQFTGTSANDRLYSRMVYSIHDVPA